ncbi:MAG: hypothetical protein HGA37_07630 [Lentimicrobium sp.]|nr:hypothetical protein [Lentimicrobium sp.]
MRKGLVLKVAAFAVLIVTAVFMVSSCDKVKELAEFDIAYTLPDVHFTIDSVDYLPKTERLLYQQTMSLNVDSIIQKHNLDGIGETQFEYVRLEIETPAWVKFSWLRSARATVSAAGLSETEVAVVTTINPDGRSVELQLTNTNVSSTISTGSFVLRLYGDLTPPLPAAVIGLVIKSKLKMTVKPV